VGFEPTVRYSRTPVFKTGAISQTLPTLLVLVFQIPFTPSIFWRKKWESNPHRTRRRWLFSRQVPLPRLFRLILPFSTWSGSRTRTGHNTHWILSPACLPIPPSKHDVYFVPKVGFEPTNHKILSLAALPVGILRHMYR
jgi:hypothetical protein